MLAWLEYHDKLSGWAQFIGAMLALALTYFTAFAPAWKRRKQLKQAGTRLLSHGYEAIESYYRTSANFLPFELSLQSASLTMTAVANEIDRFPIFELDDHGPRSLARNLVAVALNLRATALYLDSVAPTLDGREGTSEERDLIREFIGGRLRFVEALLSGAELERPEWPEPSSDV